MAKIQAAHDLIYVCEYLARNKHRNVGTPKLRIEATEKRAKERGVATQTVHRNLKLALGMDKGKNIGGVDHVLDEMVETLPKDNQSA